MLPFSTELAQESAPRNGLHLMSWVASSQTKVWWEAGLRVATQKESLQGKKPFGILVESWPKKTVELELGRFPASCHVLHRYAEDSLILTLGSPMQYERYLNVQVLVIDQCHESRVCVKYLADQLHDAVCIGTLTC